MHLLNEAIQQAQSNQDTICTRLALIEMISISSYPKDLSSKNSTFNEISCKIIIF